MVPSWFVKHKDVGKSFETESYVSNGVRLNSVGITFQLDFSEYRITANGCIKPVQFLPHLTDKLISEILEFSTIVRKSDSSMLLPVYDGKNLYGFPDELCYQNEQTISELLEIVDLSKVSSSELFTKIL